MSTFSPLIVGTYESTDRDSRRGVAIDTFIIHHSADTNQNNVLAAMQPGGRDVSANYSLKDRNLVGVVGEEWRAWTSGSPDDGGAGAAWDRRSITIEVCNSQMGGTWPVSDATFDTLARLIADWARRYGQPINDDRVLTHQELWRRFHASYPTACPGDLERRKGELLALANKYWAEGNAPKPPAKPKEIKVKKYPFQDALSRSKGRTVPKGTQFYLHDNPAATVSQAKNIVGIAAEYDVLAHAYVSGTPGDTFEITLVRSDTAAKPVKNSDSYPNIFTIPDSGVVKVTAPDAISVTKLIAVYARFKAGDQNKGDLKVTLFDTIATAYTVA